MKTSRVPDSRIGLNSLLEFEEACWEPEERATADTLQYRLTSFPEGITVLFDTDPIDGKEKPMAQLTFAPKQIPEKIEGFEQMRDLPVDLESKVLWGINLSRREGIAYDGKGYAFEVVKAGLAWARAQGYEIFMGGVTLDGLKESGLTLEEYLRKGMNPALKVFKRVATSLGMKLTASEPIPDYWPINETSLAYGQMMIIHLQGEENA